MPAGSRGQLAPGPAPRTLPPANWLPSSPSGGRHPALDTAVPGLTLRGPSPLEFLPPACQLARLLAHWTLPPLELVPAPRPATGATRPCPPRLPTGSPLQSWHVAACGRPVDRAHVVDSTKSRWMHNWPLCLHARRTRSPWCIGAIPLYRPGAAGLANGGVFTNRAKDRADAQRLVATRLLDRLHDPLGHISRLQRIHPRAR
jgi:hypothetical protein